MEFDGSPRPRTTRVHWLEVEQRLSADASVRQPAAPEKVAKLSRIEKFSRGRPDFTALTAAPWRGPELIRDPAGRSGISLRQHPAAPLQEAGPRVRIRFPPAQSLRTLGPSAQLSAIDKRFEDILLDIQVIVDDGGQLVTQRRKMLDSLVRVLGFSCHMYALLAISLIH